MMRAKFLGLMTIGFALGLSGCASFGKTMKALVGGKPVESETAHKASPQLKFSEVQDFPIDDRGRKYVRMTRDRFESEAEVDQEAGSLWTMEGQGSYLFSQNLVRTIGDVLNVRVDGEPKKQLDTKARVLKDLTDKALKADAARKLAAASGPGQSQKSGAAGSSAPAPAEPAKVEEAGDKKDGDIFSVGIIPSRIVERMQDGSYRIKGTQSFMIGSAEYRVIATGIAKSSDISDEGVDSSRLLDSKFDIVTSKKESRP
ncbi:MAG: flagellar basal body L-ring protein FlgH [Bdellovibrionales bacterium]|nr:flagellar basal body L-ring protein FlgH [Bdellovibrionales bacterium]